MPYEDGKGNVIHILVEVVPSTEDVTEEAAELLAVETDVIEIGVALNSFMLASKAFISAV
jgi:hypothetical protein